MLMLLGLTGFDLNLKDGYKNPRAGDTGSGTEQDLTLPGWQEPVSPSLTRQPSWAEGQAAQVQFFLKAKDDFYSLDLVHDGLYWEN